MVVSIATIFTLWRRLNACLNVAVAAKQVLNRFMHFEARNSGIVCGRTTVRQHENSSCRHSHAATTYPLKQDFPTAPVTMEWLQKTMNSPREDGKPRGEALGYIIEHNDGLRTTMLLTDIRDFNYAGMLEDGSIVSCQMYLPMPETWFNDRGLFQPAGPPC